MPRVVPQGSAARDPNPLKPSTIIDNGDDDDELRWNDGQPNDDDRNGRILDWIAYTRNAWDLRASEIPQVVTRFCLRRAAEAGRVLIRLFNDSIPAEI